MKLAFGILSAIVLASIFTGSAHASRSFADTFFETQKLHGENLRTKRAFGLDGYGN
ncbi:MAG: hypothetical protein NW217_07550 [Hyphomicrobiaceae bacterium]|nr:hypothetical protein [Hyphomicrobiaceae bacterium]